MKKSFILLLISVVYVAGVNGQSVLLERDINESVYVKQKGPNKKHFMHAYYNHAFYAVDNINERYDPALSYMSYFGFRNYYRFGQRYIMGTNLELGSEIFRVKQNSQKTFPSTGEHKKETLGTFNVGLEYFNRLLITKRENNLGVWLDAGIYVNLNLSSSHITKDKLSSTSEARYHKEINKRLKYVNPWEWGVKARLGYKSFALTGSYRFSDWISGTTSEYEPPRVAIGFELGLY